LKEQSQKLARKNTKGGFYLKVTLVDRGLTIVFFPFPLVLKKQNLSTTWTINRPTH
jgi:hypothetical protein